MLEHPDSFRNVQNDSINISLNILLNQVINIMYNF